jgi:uncharacterized membrane protein
MLVISLLLGIYIGLPFLAPVFMHIGWSGPGRVIYFIYSWLCHQLPERSFFLFGPKFTYSLAEVQNAWQNTINPVILRQFIGNSEILWWLLRRRVKPLPWWGLILFLLPMAIDGTSHFFSDLAGIGQGFRNSNAWLSLLTNHALSPSFYVGDAWGSFNSLMRLVTGVLFGLGIVWFGYPYMDKAFSPEIPPAARIAVFPQPRAESVYHLEDFHTR